MDNEREQVEQVFGLTGGELSDAPWDLRYTKEAFETVFGGPDGVEFRPVTRDSVYRCTYWYEGVPEYAGESFPELNHHDIYSTTHEYRTVVRDVTFGSPPERTTDGWERVAMFTSSGETECPMFGAPSFDSPAYSGSCSLCKAKPGEEHGYIYIGDGWAEVVYRRRVGVSN